MIPISSISFDSRVEELVLEVLRSGMIAQGPMVARLEESFGELIGAKHVVAVNNGTTALAAALEALGIGPGDEVITSPFTFVATINAILQVGATARFADVAVDDFCVRPASVEQLVNGRTAAVLPVHLYGQCADMPALAAVAEQHGLALVEDAAQAHGATIAGRAAGTWGTGCFSLYATKNLTSGEGGLITTNDDELADRLRVLRNQGMRERYVYEMVGHNYRLTDLQAAVCLPQIARYESNVGQRQRNADRLTDGLRDVPGLTVPEALPGRRHVWHQYTVLIDPIEFGADRGELARSLTERGIGSGIYYPRVAFDYDCYAGLDQIVEDPVPIAEQLASRCLSLPVHAGLDDDAIDRVVAAVRECAGGRS